MTCKVYIFALNPKIVLLTVLDGLEYLMLHIAQRVVHAQNAGKNYTPKRGNIIVQDVMTLFVQTDNITKQKDNDMTKKDCMKLSQALKDSKPVGFEQMTPDYKNFFAGKETAWNNTVNMIADTLKHDNPRFDRDRFLAACGYGE